MRDKLYSGKAGVPHRAGLTAAVPTTEGLRISGGGKVEHLISWETEVWIADNPSHLIHFNASRFLGPYEKTGSTRNRVGDFLR